MVQTMLRKPSSSFSSTYKSFKAYLPIFVSVTPDRGFRTDDAGKLILGDNPPTFFPHISSMVSKMQGNHNFFEEVK